MLQEPSSCVFPSLQTPKDRLRYDLTSVSSPLELQVLSFPQGSRAVPVPLLKVYGERRSKSTGRGRECQTITRKN
jgi:hypothetical protein